MSRESLLRAIRNANEMRGQLRPSRDKIVPRKFGAVAKILWTKPAEHIAAIAGVDVRTGKRILRGESDVPASVVLAACAEMLRRQE